MKKFIAILLTAILSLSVLASCSETKDTDDTFTVGVVQYISHPSLDNCYTGVAQALTARFGDKVQITRQIGSDSAADSDCATYANQFAAQNYDMIVAIATPAMPHPKPITNRMSSTMFITHPITMYRNGWKESPRARRMLDSMFSTITKGTPRK